MISLNVPTIAASALLLAVSPTKETLEFTPKADTSVVRTLHMERTTEVETATIFIMEREVDAGGGMTSSLARDVTLVDVIGKVEDGQVMDFVRTYETITDERSSEGAREGVNVSDDADDSSKLEGQEISFTWDAEEEVYAAAYVGDEPGEDEWLEGLTASLDLVNWLPSDEVGEGDTWEVALDELGPMIWYGGFLFPVEGRDEGEGPEGGISITVPNLSEVHVLSGAEGEIKMTLVRIDEEDGQRIAVATFKLSGSVDQDMTDAVNALNESRGEGGEFGSAEQSMEMTGSGELHWNLTAGRLAKLTLELQRDVDSTAEWSVDAHGTELEVSYEGEQSSTFQIELTEEQSDIEK